MCQLEARTLIVFAAKNQVTYLRLPLHLSSRKNGSMAFNFNTCLTVELCNMQEDLKMYQCIALQVPKTKGHGQQREWRMVEMTSNRVPYQRQFFIEPEYG